MDQYDPSKTPVLLIHGLISDPDTWDAMVAGLRANPDVEKHFQFLFYAYPSGTPTVPAAAVMKRELDESVKKIEKTFGISLNRKLIVIGHSMGGILAKSLVSDTGDALWDAAYTAPIEDFELTPAERQLMSEAFRYKPRDYVKKVIFMATPHRGSKLAYGFTGWLGTELSARPESVVDLSGALLKKNSDLLQPAFHRFLAHKVNAVSTLRPDSPVTKVQANLPIDPAVTFHTVPAIKNPKRPERGDGFVTPGSTYLPGAVCEVGIFSHHANNQDPEGIHLVQELLLNDSGILSEKDMISNLRKRNLAFIRFKGVNYPCESCIPIAELDMADAISP
ncbi:MAG: hypothetical protein P1U58_01315 [Verrucomicrobiales bacterium]|nr:hypothetical protein [Verrucomicrobiales bacterium]